MPHNNDEVLDYWNQDDVESMYDKHLLNAEIALISNYVTKNAKILDAGCGEGEGTYVYASVPGVIVHAVDFSETRLCKASERLEKFKNVFLKQVDFLGNYQLDNDYDIIVSQRFLINLLEWPLQQQVLMDLMAMLKPAGRLLMLEGSQQGVASLNEFRAAWGLEAIPIKWHNLFFDDDELVEFMRQNNYKLAAHAGLGAYFMLTRGVRPNLDPKLNWDCKFNQLAATPTMANLLKVGTTFSRLKLWVFEK